MKILRPEYLKIIYGIPVILLFLISWIFTTGGKTADKNMNTPEIKKNINAYGFSNDSLKVDTVNVKINSNLVDILSGEKIPYPVIMKMARVDKQLFDARKLNVGRQFFIYTKNDSTNKLCCIVYEKDEINYVVFDFGDSLKTFSGKKKVDTKEVRIAGVINNSLFGALENQNVDVELAIKLADIFAWQIDFYRVRQGDNFKIIYDEIYVDGKYYGVGKIKAAVFHHNKKDYYAFLFTQGKDQDYFDENGNSLRKVFLKTPLKFSRISSRFSGRRYHPVFHKFKAHRGIDYAAPVGTPVHSIGDGVVLTAKYRRGNGRYVKIKHNSTYQSGYLHLSRFAKGIKAGKAVKQGQVIGYVGQTGYATGPHLDLRFWKNKQLVNYLGIEFPPSKPIKNEYAAEFDSYKTNYLASINNIIFEKNKGRDNIQVSLK